MTVSYVPGLGHACVLWTPCPPEGFVGGTDAAQGRAGRGLPWRDGGSVGPSTTWLLSALRGGKSLCPFRRSPVASGQAPGGLAPDSQTLWLRQMTHVRAGQVRPKGKQIQTTHSTVFKPHNNAGDGMSCNEPVASFVR